MIKEVLVFHHSHLDIGYTHSQPIVWELQNEYLTQLVPWLESTSKGTDQRSIPRWTCEATDPVLRWIERSPPQMVDRFVALCQSKQISLTALARHITALVDRPGLQRLIEGKARLEKLISRPIQPPVSLMSTAFLGRWQMCSLTTVSIFSLWPLTHTWGMPSLLGPGFSSGRLHPGATCLF